MDNNAPEETTLDELNSKHRKEKKELQSQIQSLKKSAAKGDKKKRKEVQEEISRLELDLEKRQANQLNEFQNERNTTQPNEQATGITEAPVDEIAVQTVTNDFLSLTTNDLDNQPKLTKAQKRRNKKASEEKQREAEIQASEEENKNGPRMLEHCAIADILKKRQLKLFSIASDGDCLYKAVAHQMQLTGRNAFTVAELRQQTANYILANKEHLIFYMTNSNTGEILTDDDFINYCQNIRNTAAWGGQIEIKALSSALKVPIEVIQATGPSTIQGSEYDEPNLVVTYHRLMYSLGEHYNSTRPITDNDIDENDGEFEREDVKIDS
ncbi:deubiquitinase OTUD6B [Episyrphus balteatus]|uniref:deubiquitinase OTUD6B n=1 Tax=Episyrphus balteatus TaxID=286459 RepID=UPI0024867322|nr:deubiquitinase OTUD6B [Episyrphus balteatus]